MKPASRWTLRLCRGPGWKFQSGESASPPATSRLQTSRSVTCLWWTTAMRSTRRFLRRPRRRCAALCAENLRATRLCCIRQPAARPVCCLPPTMSALRCGPSRTCGRPAARPMWRRWPGWCMRMYTVRTKAWRRANACFSAPIPRSCCQTLRCWPAWQAMQQRG